MHMTVVICTHNRLALLKRALSSLDAARRPSSVSVDVMVVANACKDGTDEWLSNRVALTTSDGLAIRHLAEPIAGKSRALNLAVANLKAEWAVFVDDDQRVSADFFESLEKVITDQPEVRFFCGRLIPDWTGDEPSWVRDEGRYPIFPSPITRYDLGENAQLVKQGTELPAGGDLIIHKTVFEAIGDFRTELGPQGHDLMGSEDIDFVLRALDSGEVIWYRPEILQYHYVDPSRLRIGYLMRKAYQRSRSVTRRDFGGRQRIPRYFFRKLWVSATGLNSRSMPSAAR